MRFLRTNPLGFVDGHFLEKPSDSLIGELVRFRVFMPRLQEVRGRILTLTNKKIFNGYNEKLNAI